MAQHTTTPANPGGQSTALAVELRITGGNTNGALTEAEAYGKFITHIAEATKALGNAVAETRFEESKDAHGRATKRRVRIQPLLIEPATNGNDAVHITFRAPEPLPHHELTVGVEEQLPLADFPEDTIESEALRTIFRVFTAASESDSVDSEELLEPLETPAVRESVRRAVTVAQHNGWELEGSAAQLHRADEQIKLTTRGQARMADALRTDLIGKYRAPLRGTIDGHKNSNNTIYFRAAHATQSWSTEAATDVLYAEAARISLDVQNQVELTIEFEPKPDKDGNPTERVIRRIVSIDKVMPRESGERLF